MTIINGVRIESTADFVGSIKNNNEPRIRLAIAVYSKHMDENPDARGGILYFASLKKEKRADLVNLFNRTFNRAIK